MVSSSLLDFSSDCILVADSCRSSHSLVLLTRAFSRRVAWAPSLATCFSREALEAFMSANCLSALAHIWRGGEGQVCGGEGRKSEGGRGGKEGEGEITNRFRNNNQINKAIWSILENYVEVTSEFNTLHTHTRTYTHTHTHINKHIHTNTHTTHTQHTRTCTYAPHTHTYTHTHMPTHTPEHTYLPGPHSGKWAGSA